MTWSVAGATIGVLFGAGLLLIFSAMPRRRQPSFDERLGPYVVDELPASRLLQDEAAATTMHVVQRWWGPGMRRWSSRVQQWSGGDLALGRRLEQAGSPLTSEQFQAEQVVWAVLGALAGVGIAVIGSGLSVVMMLGLVLMGLGLGYTARAQVLTWQIRQRQRQIASEFTVIAELLALAVLAGMSVRGALDRVTHLCTGELATELRRVLADTHAGTPLTTALGALASRVQVSSIDRFVAGVTVAIERGTPVADVLRAQASDSQDHAHQRLLDLGGRKEIAMMIPVVFLVLPVTVMFAIFPALSVMDFQL